MWGRQIDPPSSVKKLCLNAVMRFSGLLCPFENVGLGSMEAGEVARSRGILMQADGQHDIGAGDEKLRLFDEFGRFCFTRRVRPVGSHASALCAPRIA